MTALPSSQINTATPPAPPPPYLSLERAASEMNLSESMVRRLCRERWSKQGWACKENGVWIVHPNADPRLRDRRAWNRRDLEQMAALSSEGVRPDHLKIAESRREIVRRFDDFQASGKTARVFAQFKAAMIAEGLVSPRGVKRLSQATLYEWRKNYREGGIRALVPRWPDCGRRPPTIGDKAWEYYRGLVLGGNNITDAQAYTLTRGEIERKHKNQPDWAWPGLKAIERKTAEEITLPERIAANKGLRKFDALCIPKARRDVEDIPSNDEWVGDERRLDIMCRVCGERDWKASRGIEATVWIDRRSRVITGWIIADHANSNTILGSLKAGIKQFGKPKILRVDWGRDYRKATKHIHTKRWQISQFNGPRIGGVLDQLEIEARPVEAYCPWAKSIESWFNRMRQHFDAMFASYWGGCPSERHEDRQEWTRQNLHRLPTLEEIAEAFRQYVDAYHREPLNSPGMFNLAPIEAMEAFRSEPARMESDAVLDHLFAEFIGPRKVGRDGVRFKNNCFGFGDPRIIALQGRKVWLAIQPDDVRTVMLCDENQRPLFEIACGNEVVRTREDLERHQKMRARMKRDARRNVNATRSFLLGIKPEEHIANRAAGIESMRGKVSEPERKPTLTVVRPELEEAISKAGPPPLEAASKAIRQAEESEIQLEDLLDDFDDYGPSPYTPPQDDDGVDGIDDELRQAFLEADLGETL